MTTRSRFLKLAAILVSSGVLIFFGSAPAAEPWRAGIFRAIRPLLVSSSRSAGSISGWFAGWSARARGGAEVPADPAADLAEREALRRENELLRSALALRDEGEAGAIPATAIAFIREGRDEYLLLNRGITDGIGIGDVVINARRVLGGTVTSVDEHTARVILFSSPSRSIDVIVPSIDLRAIARGANIRELSIELVPADAALKTGDLVLASPRATGGRRPLLLGEVRDVRQAEHEVFKTVRAIHLFDPGDEAVIVLLAP